MIKILSTWLLNDPLRQEKEKFITFRKYGNIVVAVGRQMASFLNREVA